MSRYKKVAVKTWGDEKFRLLSPIPPCGQGLWLYLITGPLSGGVPGLFRAGRAMLAEELRWPQEAFDKAFQEASDLGMVKADFDARVVWVPKAITYNKPESPNVVKFWGSEFDLIPECELKYEALSAIKSFVLTLDESFGKAFAEAFERSSPKASPNQEQEQEHQQEQEQIKKSIGVVFDHWKATHGHTRAQLDDKRRVLIRKALKTYTEADLRACITGYRNSPYHMGQNDSNTKYDGIELFLRDSKHIDAGLKFHVEPPSVKSNGKPGAAPNNDAAWSEAKARAKAIGFREPLPTEPIGAYMTSVKLAERPPVSQTHAARLGLDRIKRIGAK